MNDREFVDAFEACAIANSDFHHANHVRLAWIYLREHPLIEAIERFTTSLQRFAAHHGVPGVYHETITWAYLLLIHERTQRDGAPADWVSFRAANSDLFDKSHRFWSATIRRRRFGRTSREEYSFCPTHAPAAGRAENVEFPHGEK